MSRSFLSAVKLLAGAIGFLYTTTVVAQGPARRDISLNDNWYSVASDSNQHAYDGFEAGAFNVANWSKVTVPHTWDAYEGYRRLHHGNRHGYAWYRKAFTVGAKEKGKRWFLWFEGVSSYATVWVNGKKAGEHAGGRTTFTIDVTELINYNNQANTLAVRADHPAGITDLPWVCGGCSDERGFSEGSQPMGIFRPVHLVSTSEVRIEPFGVHVWNDATVSTKSATLNLETTVKNYSAAAANITITQRLVNAAKQVVVKTLTTNAVRPGATIVAQQQLPEIKTPRLWSLEDPYCYTLVTEISQNGKLIDAISTPYGIRWISWPVGNTNGGKQFLLNGKLVFINGIAEYEHLMGGSHAFSEREVKARVQQIKAVGFNAFRDAHQPHNLRYQHLLDSMGLLWWTQLSAHVWYNTPEFRNNFKTLLKEWVIERRNSPSLVLWGLQNESKLPEDFARECTELIRSLDPTASSQRKVTTCNGGAGTDWDVPQNWTGTYGGDPTLYGKDVIRQQLIGEYGAWRSLDLHTEGGFVQNGIFSEDRMTQLMELKVRLAESVKDSTCGHFFWIYNSHDNPGRVQNGEGYREMDGIGPVNYKGLLTSWEEPADAFYMFRANYAPKTTSPMVYIVSHTWPDRWTSPGIKDSIVVYSNCDSVQLFNDADTWGLNGTYLGTQTRKGIGTHFQWDRANIQYNVLYAVGYVNGKVVAKDNIVLHHLPQAPHLHRLHDSMGISSTAALDAAIVPFPGYNYLYRVNCGGADYKDYHGIIWQADREKKSANTWGSVSWTKQFPGMPAAFASQRQTYDGIYYTWEWPLFQTFRYGLQQLRYEFPVPDGDYKVALYFIEPWWGTGGGMDCTGWRVFDVAINDRTVIRDLDIWKEVGHDRLLMKTVEAHVTGGQLTISFPRIAAGQAIISAIAIATKNKQATPAPGAPLLISGLHASNTVALQSSTWLSTGDHPYSNNDKMAFSALPPALYGAEWIQTPETITAGEPGSFKVTAAADVYIAWQGDSAQRPAWLKEYDNARQTLAIAGSAINLYRKRFAANATVVLGSNDKAAKMYNVIVVPVTKLPPAFDFKPTTNYRTPQAGITGTGAERQMMGGREAIVFTKPAGAAIEFTVETGVGDVYSFSFRYNNPSAKPLKATWQLLQADGTVLKTEAMECTNTIPGKWNYFTTTSGSMINAGKYTVRVTAVDAEGLVIGGVDVQ